MGRPGSTLLSALCLASRPLSWLSSPLPTLFSSADSCWECLASALRLGSWAGPWAVQSRAERAGSCALVCRQLAPVGWVSWVEVLCVMLPRSLERWPSPSSSLAASGLLFSEMVPDWMGPGGVLSLFTWCLLAPRAGTLSWHHWQGQGVRGSPRSHLSLFQHAYTSSARPWRRTAATARGWCSRRRSSRSSRASARTPSACSSSGRSLMVCPARASPSGIQGCLCPPRCPPSPLRGGASHTAWPASDPPCLSLGWGPSLRPFAA